MSERIASLDPQKVLHVQSNATVRNLFSMATEGRRELLQVQAIL